MTTSPLVAMTTAGRSGDGGGEAPGEHGGNVPADTVTPMVEDATARFAALVARQDQPLPWTRRSC